MGNGPDELHEAATPILAPQEMVERDAALVRRFPECFWFWHPEARVRYLQDVRLVMDQLRDTATSRPGERPRYCTD